MGCCLNVEHALTLMDGVIVAVSIAVVCGTIFARFCRYIYIQQPIVYIIDTMSAMYKRGRGSDCRDGYFPKM